MKKYVFICLLAILAIGFTSCNKDSVPFHKETIDLVVKADNWEFDEEANMFFCRFEVPSLTEKVYNFGEVSVSREYNTGTPKAYQVILPETTYQAVDLDNGDGTTTPYYYQQHIDYATAIGFIDIFCTISDFYYNDFNPGNMLFRLQMSW
jgi:hypothetical protein